jgi:hypothetical protein
MSQFDLTQADEPQADEPQADEPQADEPQADAQLGQLAEVPSMSDAEQRLDTAAAQDELDADELDAAEDQMAADPDVVVAEVIETEPARQTPDSDTGALGPQWHNIQASFVDDPRGSVELAAQAADAALSALVAALHERQAALGPAGGVPNDPGDTERLREALLSYRIFCQSLTDISQLLPRPEAMAS